jgi:hypothetical protein
LTSTASLPYRRAVLGMAAGSVDRQMLQAAAEFARLLELEMLGVFIENQSLIGLAALPFARELRLPGYGWHVLDRQRLDDELRAAALQAGQIFQREVASRGVTCRFEVHRGDPVTLASNVAQASDILIVAETVAFDPHAPGGEPAQRAALASAAAVLLLPRSGMPLHGPVAAVAAGQPDACLEVAARIAASTGEQALALPPLEPVSSAALAESLQRVLGLRRERLLVVPRQAAMPSEILLQLAARRQTPILVLAS